MTRSCARWPACAGAASHLGQPSATFALTGFYGAVPFGQFFETTSTYIGVILFLSAG